MDWGGGTLQLLNLQVSYHWLMFGAKRLLYMRALSGA